MNQLRRLYLLFVPMVFVLTMPSVQAQSQLDISQCYNQLLQQQRNSSSYVRLRLAFLSQVTEKNYEQSKHEANLFVPGIATGDYKDFDEKRREYFKKVQLDIDYYKSVSISSTTLDKEAYKLIENCINAVASSQFGLHFLASVDDDTSSAVQFFWKPLTERPELDVVDSVLENAEVVGSNVPKGKLFIRGNGTRLKPYPKITANSPTILLRRIDPTKPIRATVQTRPQVGSAAIVIPRFPKEPVFETQFRTQIATESFVKSRIGTGVPRGQGHEFKALKEVNGTIISIDCSWPPGVTHHHFDNCAPVQANSNKAICEGWTNDGNPYAMNMTVKYKEPYTICTKNCGGDLDGENKFQAEMNSKIEELMRTKSISMEQYGPLSSIFNLNFAPNQEKCSWTTPNLAAAVGEH